MQDTIGESLGAMQFDDYQEEDETTELAVVETPLDLSQQQMQAKEDKFLQAQDYVNDNMKNIIEKGMDGLNDIMEVMVDSQDPKMYNACASYIKTLVDANKSFLENNKYGVASIAKNAGNGGAQVKEQPQNVTQIQVNNGDVKVLTPQQMMDALNEIEDDED